MNFFSNLVKTMRIKQGDIVYLASDLVPILIFLKNKNKIFNPDDLVNSILNALGSKGTLIIPSFNWNFCKGIAYDVLKSRAQTGSLANFILKNRKDFSRTSHPIYSFLVSGRYKELLLSYNNTCGFDIDSPFNFFFEKNIKLISLGTPPSESFSIIHYFEQKANLEYRYKKNFKANYIDTNHVTSFKTYSAFVRKLKYKKRRDYDDSFWKLLKKKNILFLYEYENISISTLYAKEAGNIILKDLLRKRKYYPEKIKQR